MKHTKTLLVAALAALSIGSASAETIYITGSTAFRSAANSTLYSLFGSNLMATASSATNATTDPSAGSLLFTNCAVNGTNVDISVFWSGSEAGIQTVASGTNTNKVLPFFDKTLISSNFGSFPATGLAQGTFGATVANSTNTTFQKGTITFSDTFQGASAFVGGAVAADNVQYNTLSDTKVGVVPFLWVANKTFPYTDITASIIGDLYANGFVAANQFDGLTSSTNSYVWAMGRNPDSGTRVTTLVVAKYGITKAVLQFKPTAASGVITSIAKEAAGNVNGISIAAGNNGQSSGGTLCGFLTNTFSATVGVPIGFTRGSTTNYAIAYAGASDAQGKYSGGLVPLTFNGVQGRLGNTNTALTTLDAGYTNIISGKYPFWSYEHVMYDTNFASGQATNLASTLVTTITGYASTNSALAPNIALGDMKVKRTQDGGAQTPQ